MRKHSFAIVVISFFLASAGIAMGQGPANQPGQAGEDVSQDPKTIPAGQNGQTTEILQRLERLEAELRSLRDGAVRELTGRVGANETALQQVAESVATNGDAIRGLLNRIDENDTAISQLQLRVVDNNTKLLDIARQDSQGGWYPNLLGNVQKPEFRHEIREVVAQTGATQGRLWINNPSAFDHVIYINGARWRALTGWSYVWVPFGNVSVSHIGGVTPSVRRATDWRFNQQDGVYDLEYPGDFNQRWR